MGAYPQGNRREHLVKLIKENLIDLCNTCGVHCRFYRSKPRPDRYKSYRARRRFKRLVLAELLDAQRSKYMRTIEDVLEED